MRKAAFVLLVACLLFLPLSAQAGFYTDRASWEAAVDTWYDIPIPYDEGTVLSAGTVLALPGGGSLTLGNTVVVAQVPTTWPSWGAYLDPKVLVPQDPSEDWWATTSGVYGFAWERMLEYPDGSYAGPFFLGLTEPPISPGVFNPNGREVAARMVVGYQFAPVPEPCTMLLVGGGLLGLAGLRRKRG